MKVAIIGSKEFDSLEFHLKDELIFQNHQAEIFDYKTILNSKISYSLTLISPKFVEFLNKKVLEEVLDYCPDLVIGVYRHIHPLVVKEIKLKGIQIIHINPDALTTFQNQQLFVEEYDCYYTKDPYILSFLRDKLNFNAKYYNEAFNPRFHKKSSLPKNIAEEEVKIDLLAFGNLYPYRNRMLSLIEKENIKFKIFGHKAKYFSSNLSPYFEGRPIFGEEKSKILYGSKIIINNFHYAEIESVNNKFFEVNGVGAFQLSDYKKILHEILPVDPKKVSFKNTCDLNNKIKYFLNEPEERYYLSGLIYEHFNKYYTYKELIKLLLE